jgi:hypothetical protein
MSELDNGTMEIPDELVTAAGYAQVDERVVCDFIGEDLLRAALAVAFPSLMAKAWDEGYENGTLSQFQEPHNPYR